jgi:hypothetical protein
VSTRISNEDGGQPNPFGSENISFNIVADHEAFTWRVAAQSDSVGLGVGLLIARNSRAEHLINQWAKPNAVNDRLKFWHMIRQDHQLPSVSSKRLNRVDTVGE